jgi:hypothetical protein
MIGSRDLGGTLGIIDMLKALLFVWPRSAPDLGSFLTKLARRAFALKRAPRHSVSGCWIDPARPGSCLV